jgi:tRNA(adenine34) deaminase
MARPRAQNPGGPIAGGDTRLHSFHEAFMRVAIEGARTAMHVGEVPIGAVVVHEGRIVAQGFNQPIHLVDPTAHAEVVALREAARVLGNYRLPGSTLYVTLEPCLMCVGALMNARVGTVVYGAAEPKFGALQSILSIADVPANHRFAVVAGVLEAECRQLVVDFFKFRREEG